MADGDEKRILNVEDFQNELDFDQLKGIEGATIADVDLGVAETKVVHYPAGAIIPMHTHTGQTFKVILTGAIQFEDGIVRPGSIYHCNPRFSYSGTVLLDTYLLLVQTPGSCTVREDDGNGVQS